MKGQYLQRLGRYSDSVSFMTKEIMKYPTNDLLWVTFGLIHEAEGKFNSALKCYTTARHHLTKRQTNNTNVKYLDDKIKLMESKNI